VPVVRAASLLGPLNAAGALADIGPEARDALPALRRAFQKHQGHLFVAPKIVEALSRMGQPAVPVLIDALKSNCRNNYLVQEAAATGLGKIGPEAREAVPTLIAMLKKDDKDVRRRACQVLGKIGPEARAAVPALKEALKDKNDSVRESAAWAFVRIDPDTAKQEGIQDPPAVYYAGVCTDGTDFESDDNARASADDLGERVILWVNGKRASDDLLGRHEKPVYIKITRQTGGRFRGRGRQEEVPRSRR